MSDFVLRSSKTDGTLKAGTTIVRRSKSRSSTSKGTLTSGPIARLILAGEPTGAAQASPKKRVAVEKMKE